MEQYLYAQRETGLNDGEIAQAVENSLAGKNLRRVLLIPPDFTRYHSNAGRITNLYYHALTERGCEVEVLTALGTHAPVTRAQAEKMFGDLPYEKLIPHDWRRDVVTIGTVPGEYLAEITEGLWTEPITAQVNRRVVDPSFDAVFSVGQVVPHEVIGMANHAKNLFVGVGGSEMINKSHMVGAVYGMERVMGRDHTPVRKIFDYALTKFLSSVPLTFVLTVCTASGDDIRTHGLFIGESRTGLEKAIALAQKKNLDYVSHPIRKCVVRLDPNEFTSTWLGNKAIYRTRMAIADGGELVILAPGVERFGEDKAIDALIRKYGYRGRNRTLALMKDPTCGDLRENMSAAAHLIHGSTDDRFSVTYAVSRISREEIESVGFRSADYEETARRYDPEKLRPGFQTMPDGEEIFYIPNPALGLWIDRRRME